MAGNCIAGADVNVTMFHVVLCQGFIYTVSARDIVEKLSRLFRKSECYDLNIILAEALIKINLSRRK